MRSLSPDFLSNYSFDPSKGPGWFYRGLRIQAEVTTHQLAARWALNNLAEGARILDLATGEGALAQQLSDLGFDVSCTSWDDRSRADAKCYKIDLDHAFSTSDVGGEPFDAVMAVEIIEHVENPAQLLRSCRGLLQDGGLLFLSTPNVESARARLQWLARGQPLWFTGDEVTRNRHISMMWRDQLDFFLSQSGFSITERPLVPDVRSESGQRGLRGLLKKTAYGLIARLGSGEPLGDTRIYVAQATSPVRNASENNEFY